ncbi:MAG: hypothetical protein F6K47_29680, partial [Symploca sp. SIO2E6]|nr:hypothetical protein [Symploca sp. SIO2E6]
MSNSFYPHPEIAPDDKIHFVEYHRPALKSGDYQLKVQQTIQLANKIPKETIGDRTVKFSVQGERFALKSSEIHHVYPPENSNGIFHRVLPHIILNRTTLPWERTPNGGTTDEILSPSWMALLLFTEDELGGIQQQNVTVEKLNKASQDPKPYWKPLPKETTQQEDQAVTVVDVPWSTLSKIIPTYSDLRLMAHVRQVESASETRPDSEVTILISQRLPPLDKNCTVHLVSLEQRYQPFEIESNEAIAFDTLKEHGYDIIDLRTPGSDPAKLQLVKFLQPFAADSKVQELELVSGATPRYLAQLSKGFTQLKTKPEGKTDDEWMQQTVEDNCEYLLGLISKKGKDVPDYGMDFHIWADNQLWLDVQIQKVKVRIEGRTVESLKAVITRENQEFPENADSDLLEWISDCFSSESALKKLHLDPSQTTKFVGYDDQGKEIKVNYFPSTLSTVSNDNLFSKIETLTLATDHWKTNQCLPQKYYAVDNNTDLLLSVSFDDSRSSAAQTAGTTPKPNSTISRVPTPFP